MLTSSSIYVWRIQLPLAKKQGLEHLFAKFHAFTLDKINKVTLTKCTQMYMCC